MNIETKLQVENLSVESLAPDPANPRQIDLSEMEALTRSIQQFGFIQPVVARRDGLAVIGGHQRLVAARRLGMKTVPVVLLDIGPERARVLGLALNRVGGTWDEELLARLLKDLRTTPDVDVSLSGFTEDEVKDLLKTLDVRERRERPETFDFAQAMEEARREPKTAPGDIWSLGDHRLMCGDATDAAAVDRLLGGTKTQMAFTDPPYNVDYGHHGNLKWKARGKKIQNDALTPEAWEAFCSSWASNLLGSVEGAVYVCMSGQEWPTVTRVLAGKGGHWSTTLIWSKDRFTLGRADYQRQYEPLWYGWRVGAKHVWNGGRDQGDIWRITRPHDSPLHPTMKPLELVERAIGNSSERGDKVLDLFLGSGSTLIACERTGRICYGMEIDRHYCDVVIARFESFSGEKATKLAIDERHEETA